MSISSTPADTTLYQRPAELLQHLIRFDTTNPPGDEAACIAYIHNLLTEMGFQTMLFESSPGRPNLIARLQGSGKASPLLLQGHIDVVTAEKQDWQHPPFSGAEIDGYIWGRGTLDMKGGVAMMLAALMRAKVEGAALPGDVILAVVSDEEVGGECGAHFLVEQHPDLFKDVRYALGEIGGFTLHLGGKRFYPIQVLEKQMCWLRGVVRGPGGHGSIPMRGGSVAKLGHVIQRLDQQRLPTHITPVPRQMIEAIANASSEPLSTQVRQLLDPTQTNRILDQPGFYRQLFEPVLHNTVNLTLLRGGEKVNVIPGEIVVELDGRLLPGFSPEDMLHELHDVVGHDIEFEVLKYGKGQTEADMSLYETLAAILREADPEGIPIPIMMPVVTDGRFFSTLGIQTYGFLPMNLPEGLNYLEALHAADERIPVAAMEFGTRAMYEAIRRPRA